jgi:hypothetical protein
VSRARHVACGVRSKGSRVEQGGARAGGASCQERTEGVTQKRTRSSGAPVRP